MWHEYSSIDVKAPGLNITFLFCRCQSDWQHTVDLIVVHQDIGTVSSPEMLSLHRDPDG